MKLFSHNHNMHMNNTILWKKNFEEAFTTKMADVILCSANNLYPWKRIVECPNLKVIASNTTSDSHIDVEYCKERGIEVITLKEDPILQHITAVAELTIGLIIALTRNIIPAYDSVFNGEWSRWPFGGKKMLKDMKLGIYGLGRIGNHVWDRVENLFKYVYRYDNHLIDTNTYSPEDILMESDIITVHIPKEGNEGLFNKEIFSKFKDGSYFVNTSRGEIVDDDALIWALESGKLAGAAVDVLSGEFNADFDANDHPLVEYAREHDNLIITPHIGGSTEDAWEMTQKRIIEKTIEYFKEKKDE